MGEFDRQFNISASKNPKIVGESALEVVTDFSPGLMALVKALKVDLDSRNILVDQARGPINKDGALALIFASSNTDEAVIRIGQLDNPPDSATVLRPAARFVCVLSVASPEGFVLARGTGTCEGVLIEDARGRGGFGYDPHFLVVDLDRTFAELLPSEKNAISHRARAGADLRRALAPLLR